MSGASLSELLRSGFAMRANQRLTRAQMLMAANAPILAKTAMQDGDPVHGYLPSGSVAGVIGDRPTCAELIERIVGCPHPVTLVPTGPLTNVALLLDRIGGDNIQRIVLMGGAVAEGNMTPAAELNIWADPEAAARVFGSGLDVTMIGLDVTHRAVTTPALQQRLRATGAFSPR